MTHRILRKDLSVDLRKEINEMITKSLVIGNKKVRLKNITPGYIFMYRNQKYLVDKVGCFVSLTCGTIYRRYNFPKDSETFVERITTIILEVK